MSIIGWREWVALPELGIDWTKAKVDTGARTSALHAFDIEYFEKADVQWLRFKIHPYQKNTKVVVVAEAVLLELRNVTSSNGKTERRPVIKTTISLLDKSWPIELTLTNRDTMGFRMLLGRQGIPKHMLVNPHSSFLSEKPTSKEHTVKKPQKSTNYKK